MNRQHTNYRNRTPNRSDHQTAGMRTPEQTNPGHEAHINVQLSTHERKQYGISMMGLPVEQQQCLQPWLYERKQHQTSLAQNSAAWQTDAKVCSNALNANWAEHKAEHVSAHPGINTVKSIPAPATVLIHQLHKNNRNTCVRVPTEAAACGYHHAHNKQAKQLAMRIWQLLLLHNATDFRISHFTFKPAKNFLISSKSLLVSSKSSSSSPILTAISMDLASFKPASTPHSPLHHTTNVAALRQSTPKTWKNKNEEIGLMRLWLETKTAQQTWQMNPLMYASAMLDLWKRTQLACHNRWHKNLPKPSNIHQTTNKRTLQPSNCQKDRHAFTNKNKQHQLTLHSIHVSNLPLLTCGKCVLCQTHKIQPRPNFHLMCKTPNGSNNHTDSCVILGWTQPSINWQLAQPPTIDHQIATPAHNRRC